MSTLDREAVYRNGPPATLAGRPNEGITNRQFLIDDLTVLEVLGIESCASGLQCGSHDERVIYIPAVSLRYECHDH